MPVVVWLADRLPPRADADTLGAALEPVAPVADEEAILELMLLGIASVFVAMEDEEELFALHFCSQNTVVHGWLTGGAPRALGSKAVMSRLGRNIIVEGPQEYTRL